MSFSFFSFCFAPLLLLPVSFPPLLLSCNFKYFLSSPFLSLPFLSFPFLFSCLLLPFHVSSFLVSCPSLLSYFLLLLHLCIISFLSSPLLSFIHILAPFLISSPLSHFSFLIFLIPIFLLSFLSSLSFPSFCLLSSVWHASNEGALPHPQKSCPETQIKEVVSHLNAHTCCQTSLHKHDVTVACKRVKLQLSL